MPGLPGERDIRPARLRFLKVHLGDGTFVGPNWAIAVQRETGETFRINGQHSSNLLVSLAPEEFPQGLNVTIDVFEFTDMGEDVAGLFDLFDHPRSTRTDTDFMGITRAHYQEFAGMENGFLVKVASGVYTNIKNRADKATDPILRQELESQLISHRYHGVYFMEDIYRDFAVWLYRWHDAPHFKFVGRSGVTSEIFDDWISTPKYATEFWGHVFLEDHPDREHESRELLNELKSLEGKPKKVPADEWQKKSRKYWNRYFKVRRTQEPPPPEAATEPVPPSVPPSMSPSALPVNSAEGGSQAHI